MSNTSEPERHAAEQADARSCGGEAEQDTRIELKIRAEGELEARVERGGVPVPGANAGHARVLDVAGENVARQGVIHGHRVQVQGVFLVCFDGSK